MMEKKLVLGTAGGLALILGTLLPIVSNDMTGELSLLKFDMTYGVMMLVIAALSILLAVLGRHRQLFIAAVPAAGFVLATYYKLHTARSSALEILRGGDADSMDGFTRMIINAGASLTAIWPGWTALLVGLICILIAAWPSPTAVSRASSE